MTHIIVCGPRNVIEVSRKTEHESKWCFVCRKRVSHVRVVMLDDIEEDWYGPWAVIECENGHQDGDLFPGWERTWAE